MSYIPRLPKNVPLSKRSVRFDGQKQIGAALVFACTNCWHTDKWSFIAYNQDGQVFQVRKCMNCLCDDKKGKWITQDEQFEKTKWELEA